MAALIGSHGAARFGGPGLPRPAAVIMAYMGHADIFVSEPPTFAVVGERDGISPPASMQRRVDALQRLGIPTAFRVYPRIGHGFGLGIGTSADGWIGEAIAFWKLHVPR
jgi:acetyl esterase/lipase